jgi:uncharacterized membrane protein YhhN
MTQAPPERLDAPSERARPARLAVCSLLAAATGLCVAAMLAAQYLGLQTNAHLLLMAASTGFVLIPIAAGGLRSAYGALIAIGLVLCWLGDLVGPTNFTGSLAAFLLAHVAFIVAFLTRGVIAWRAGLGLVAGTIAGSLIGVWLLPHLPGEMRVPVLAYMVVISLMVILAAGVREGHGRPVVLLGALAFYVSDIFVARWKFVDSSSVNAYFCYPLYYAGCLMLALSVLAYRRRPAADDPC